MKTLKNGKKISQILFLISFLSTFAPAAQAKSSSSEPSMYICARSTVLRPVHVVGFFCN